MADRPEQIARMLGYRDATRLLLSRMSVLNDVLKGRLPRKQRKELKRKFEACDYALNLLNTHYFLLYGDPGDD